MTACAEIDPTAAAPLIARYGRHSSLARTAIHLMRKIPSAQRESFLMWVVKHHELKVVRGLARKALKNQLLEAEVQGCQKVHQLRAAK